MIIKKILSQNSPIESPIQHMLGIISVGGFQMSPSMAPVWFLPIGGACHRRNSYASLIGWNSFAYQSLRRGGGSRGGARGPRLPLIFRPNWGRKDQKKVFLTPPRPPLFPGLYDRPPPPPYLKVWIRHCIVVLQ